jgi:nudix-type nucleoside diphosphatase (YffH/AdpP family)
MRRAIACSRRDRASSMNETIKILSRDILSRGFGLLQRVNLRRQKFDASVQEICRDIYDTGDGVAILLYDAGRGRVLLVRQFRLAAYLASGRESLVEVCAGKLEGLDAAARVILEVAEETGYRIQNPRFLFEAFMSPGVFSERLSFFVAPYTPADKAGDGGGLAAEDEDIALIEPTLDEALNMIAKGEIVDAKTILLLHYAKLTGLL